MKQAAIRVEIIKGDASKDIPWVRMVRTIERDRTQVISVEHFADAKELQKTKLEHQ